MPVFRAASATSFGLFRRLGRSALGLLENVGHALLGVRLTRPVRLATTCADIRFVGRRQIRPRISALAKIRPISACVAF